LSDFEEPHCLHVLYSQSHFVTFWGLPEHSDEIYCLKVCLEHLYGAQCINLDIILLVTDMQVIIIDQCRWVLTGIVELKVSDILYQIRQMMDEKWTFQQMVLFLASEGPLDSQQFSTDHLSESLKH